MYVLLRYIGVSLNLFISIYRGTGTNPTIGERDAFIVYILKIYHLNLCPNMPVS